MDQNYGDYDNLQDAAPEIDSDLEDYDKMKVAPEGSGASREANGLISEFEVTLQLGDQPGANYMAQCVEKEIEKEQNMNSNEFDQQPWRQPGVNLAEWFNFGHNEEQWKLFVNKHLTMMYEKNRISKTIRDSKRRRR